MAMAMVMVMVMKDEWEVDWDNNHAVDNADEEDDDKIEVLFWEDNHSSLYISKVIIRLSNRRMDPTYNDHLVATL